MRIPVLTLVLVLGLIALPACAGYSVMKHGCGKGYDVYRPDPYLLRAPIQDKDGNVSGFKFDVVWLPNYSERYRVTSWTGFGASNIKFTFEDGWKFTGIHDQTDNTKILETLADLTKHVIPADPGAIAQSGTGEERWDLLNESNQPVLYKIEFDACGDICGLKRFYITECSGTGRSRAAPIPRSKQPTPAADPDKAFGN